MRPERRLQTVCQTPAAVSREDAPVAPVNLSGTVHFARAQLHPFNLFIPRDCRESGEVNGQPLRQYYCTEIFSGVTVTDLAAPRRSSS